MGKRIWFLLCLIVLQAILSWSNWGDAHKLNQMLQDALRQHAQSRQTAQIGTPARASSPDVVVHQADTPGWRLIDQAHALLDDVLTRQAWSLAAMATVLAIGMHAYLLSEREMKRRRQAEAKLLAEQTSLEKRIELRTAELRAEIEQRSRAEERNRRQKRVLELLANRAPLEEIFSELTSSIVVQRRSWESAIHLVDPQDAVLKLIASSEVPERLEYYLRSISADFPDAPESMAWATSTPRYIQSLNQEHRPWSEFLFSNGIRSAWSLPLLRDDGHTMGTLTIYSRLFGLPSELEREILDSAVRLTSLVLEVQHMNRELLCKAYQDELTGIANRRAGEIRLQEAIVHARAQQHSFSLLWIDLDRFKRINDLYGHARGDQVLVEVSKRLARHPAVKDALARMGGDEFLVLLEPCTSEELARQTAEELAAAIAEPMLLGDETTTVGASIGITLFPRDGETPDELERHADAAMYQAKRHGLGCCAFSSAMREEVRRATSIEEGLLEALDMGSGQEMLDVHYQPIYTAEGELSGMEALLRFKHPRLGKISPDQFIPIAEESGLILPLGSWVLRRVCQQIVAWNKTGFPPLRIGVNISGIQWDREEFVDDVRTALNESGASAHALTLELTESVMMQNTNRAMQHMRELKSMGVRFAMDDFGTGYSSLSYLHQLPLDTLKIDRSFISRMCHSGDSRAIVDSVITMAHLLGIYTVAEGVETEEQHRILTEMKCDAMQGFLMAKPMSCQEIDAMFQTMLAPQAPFAEGAPINHGLIRLQPSSVEHEISRG